MTRLARIIYPPVFTGGPLVQTGRSLVIGESDDGLKYCLKTGPREPAAEYLCHCLARACGVPVPQFDIVELSDGTRVFGSAWEGSTLSRHQDLPPGRRQIARALSRIYAFDLFVHNADRHIGNFLYVKGEGPGCSVKAIDFGHALTVHWPLPALPLPDTCNTVVAARELRAAYGFDNAEAERVLDQIDAIGPDVFQRIVDRVPAAWLDMETRTSCVQWWESGRTERTKEIRLGLANSGSSGSSIPSTPNN